MLSRTDIENFKMIIYDLMENYKDNIDTAEDVEDFSDDLHDSLESAIQEMLLDGFNNIDAGDYDAQY